MRTWSPASPPIRWRDRVGPPGLVAAALAVAAMGLGCGDNSRRVSSDAGQVDAEPADAATPVTQLELDIVVASDLVALYVQESERPCGCDDGVFVQPGESITFTDLEGCFCDPTPGSCLGRVQLWRDSATGPQLAYEIDDYNGFFGVALLKSADLVSDSHRLVLEGCGGRAEIPVGPHDAPEPSLGSFAIDGRDLLVAWSNTPATGTALVTERIPSTDFGRTQHAVSSPARIPGALDTSADSLSISVSSLAPLLEIPTEYGTARVWHRSTQLESALWTPP